jgi:hypothetical protein
MWTPSISFRPRGWCALLALSLAVSAASCARPTRERRAGAFPAREELGSLAATLPGADLFDRRLQSVDRWDLEGPFPETLSLAPREAAGAWEALLAERISARPNVMMSEAMTCAARELARFNLEHDAGPTNELVDFIARRCGAVSVHIGWRGVRAQVPVEASEEEIFARWREQLGRSAAALGRGPTELGIAFVRGEGRAAAVLVSGQLRARLEPIERLPGADGAVVLKGEFNVPAQTVRALATRGTHGVVACEPDRSVRLPSFAWRCPVDPADPQVRIELATLPPGRVLGDAAVELIVWPQGAPAAFVRDAGAPGGPASADLAEELVRLVNEVRARAGSSPLRLERAQSEFARRLAGHYFAAQLGGAPVGVADLVALGMQAGYEVEGAVVSGGFAAGWTSGPDEAHALVSRWLASPFSRQVLLASAASSIAVGPLRISEAGGLAAIVGTYELLDPRASAELPEKVVARLDAARARRGAPPVAWAPAPPPAEEAMAALRAGELSTEAALEVVLRSCADSLGRGVRGWVVRVSSLEELEFAEELLRGEPPLVLVAVGHFQPEDWPWWQHVVILVLPSRGGQTAQTAPGGEGGAQEPPGAGEANGDHAGARGHLPAGTGIAAAQV